MGDQLELLELERTDAWFEYLHDTRDQRGITYVEVESWAWARLTQRLRAIASREKKFAAAA